MFYKKFLFFSCLFALAQQPCRAQTDLVPRWSRIILRLGNDEALNKTRIDQALNNKNARGYTQLYLYCGQLKQIPAAVFSLKNIKELYIEGDSLVAVPAGINQMQKLTALHFGPTQIARFERPLQLPRLVHFSLYASRLNAFPEGLLQCTALQYLSLQRSGIDAIPAGLSKLKRLESLDLSDNRITQMPVELFQCTSLKSLVLEANNIDRVPAAIQQLQNLEELDVLANPVREFATEIAALPKLRYFFYGGHPQSVLAFGVTPGDMDNFALTWKRVKKATEAVYGKSRSLGKPGGMYYLLFMNFSAERVLQAAQNEDQHIHVADAALGEQTAIVKSGLGTAVDTAGIWNGRLQAGAVIRLRGNGNKPAIFNDYIYDSGKKIIGISYWSEGDSRLDTRIKYETYRDIHSKEFLDLEFPTEIVRATNFR